MNGNEETWVHRVQGILDATARALAAVKEQDAETVVRMAHVVAGAFRSRRRLYLFGNGGSAADSQHLAAEFINRFQRERDPLPAMALTTDTSVLTSIANDYDFRDVFLRQLRGLGEAGDVALGLSTSGRSENVLRALRWAREHGLHTLGLAGAQKTDMDVYCDLILHVPDAVTARVQEVHITVGHALCDLVEEMLYGAGASKNPMSPVRCG
ncbi:D-sedoheptulose-7-phosphate isomerase [Desulfosoma caldarium]|uniref:Phosphoheptose isomerase n=1 Tax=Desulfosoma caldarium TaxID=610254 RepID=A0A3N1UYE3_9BACT|nr:SIS domain-containing protein [Desulfosoma caldarium]ROQ93577.1 D-sedoheptulose 7-phosphate isomerase [Desulfosoma caldarium]